MPLKSHWYVRTTGYASQEAKNRIESNPGKSQLDDYQIVKRYSGYSQASAMKAFFEASTEAMANDLIINVIVDCDAETIVEMRPDHHPERQ